MKDDSRLFQLYLLGQMRNDVAVERAVKLLGASKADIPHARQRMIEAGLEQVGAPFKLYEQLLGEPAERTVISNGEDYERVRMAFRFDLWPGMVVVVLGSTEGHVGSIRFEHTPPDPNDRPLRVSDLQPWNNVRSDLLQAQWTLTPRDEWYPMLDVEATAPSSSGRALLLFDFDLLQAVLPLRD